MAKPSAKPADDKTASDEPLLKFRDKVYTSRTLCIPGTERTLPVAKATVEVPASDEQAVSFLKANPEFEAKE